MNSSIEKLCLKWNGFQENVSSAFGDCRKDREFADITLACEGGYQVEAHKVILASSSPFFSDLLRKNKHPHPLVFMRGLKSEDLEAIVDFLYCGEASVFQEHLDSFLVVAEELKLKGLTGIQNSDIETPAPTILVEGNDPREYEVAWKEVGEVQKGVREEGESLDVEVPLEGQEEDMREAVKEVVVKVEETTQDEAIISEGVEEAATKMVGKHSQNSYYCKKCGKEFRSSVVTMRHAEVHLNIRVTCSVCGVSAMTRNALSVHYRFKHNMSVNFRNV